MCVRERRGDACMHVSMCVFACRAWSFLAKSAPEVIVHECFSSGPPVRMLPDTVTIFHSTGLSILCGSSVQRVLQLGCNTLERCGTNGHCDVLVRL